MKNIVEPSHGDDEVCNSWHHLDFVIGVSCSEWVSASVGARTVQSCTGASVSSGLSQLLSD